MCTAGNWTFHSFVSSPPSLIRRFLLIFLLIQLKPKHHRLDVLTIFQRGAVFRDTLLFEQMSRRHWFAPELVLEHSVLSWTNLMTNTLPPCRCRSQSIMVSPWPYWITSSFVSVRRPTSCTGSQLNMPWPDWSYEVIFLATFHARWSGGGSLTDEPTGLRCRTTRHIDGERVAIFSFYVTQYCVDESWLVPLMRLFDMMLTNKFCMIQNLLRSVQPFCGTSSQIGISLRPGSLDRTVKRSQQRRPITVTIMQIYVTVW